MIGFKLIVFINIIFLYFYHLLEVDVDRLCSSPIQEVDLKNNPLTPETWQKLEKITSITVTMDPPKDDLDDMD